MSFFKHDPWVKLWIAAAAGLAVLIALGPWLTYRVHDWRIERRLDHLAPLMQQYAKANDLSPSLVRSVVRAESGGDPHAVSSKHARGLMQITPITLREVQRRFDLPEGDLFDPAYNLDVGSTYLSYLLRRFHDDPYLALAAYHMGPTAVSHILHEHPKLTGVELVNEHANPTTRAYVHHVLARVKSNDTVDAGRLNGQ